METAGLQVQAFLELESVRAFVECSRVDQPDFSVLNLCVGYQTCVTFKKNITQRIYTWDVPMSAQRRCEADLRDGYLP